MTSLAITNVRLLLDEGPQPGTLLVDGGTIERIAPSSESPPVGAAVIDGGGRILAPGLIDTHVHGGGGHALMTDDPEEVRAYARWVVRHGVTSFLISTSGRDHQQILHRLRALAPVVGPVEGGARVLGFHLEGPYINPARKGAFDPRWLRPPNAAQYRELYEASGGAVRQVTLAPELPGADALIDAVVASGAVASIGHSDATYEQAMQAFELGVSHATHTFNAMRPFSHRDPGLLGAIMTSDMVTAELIGDGAHVDYPAASVLLRAKGAGNVVLVTDGMPLAGTPDGEASWEGIVVRVEGGKAVRASDGTIVGGVMTLDAMVRDAVAHLGVQPHEAIAMASANPARALHLDAVGTLTPGACADFVLLDDNLHVTETWVAGARVYARESS